jgi:SNF2 family DNA or RNA helicase
LESAGIPHGIFIGSTAADDRARIIEGFQSGKLQVFAGTIAAGGIGITLTASSTVVFIDRSWSASLNIQAEDRCHRIGQKSAVQIIDIISRGTLDIKRIQKINMQWGWIKRLIGDEAVEEGMEDYDYDDSDW